MSKLTLTAISHLGRDCSVRDVNGVNAINFSIAVTEKYKDKTGVAHERTTWIECTVWRKPEYSKVAEFFKKGTLVFVEGRPEARGYKSKNNEDIHGTLTLRVDELILLGKPSGSPSEGVASENAVNTVVSEIGKEDDMPF